ncbi:MAG TPA: DM13 domain-containing protein [Chloroflexia bacterium]|nr:DM13 domain-containing protein [Chloroflexia bacterium]
MTPDDPRNRPPAPSQPHQYQPTGSAGQYDPRNAYQVPQQPFYNPPSPGYSQTQVKAMRRRSPFLLWGGLTAGLLVAAAIVVLVIIPLFNRNTKIEDNPFAPASAATVVASNNATTAITPGAANAGVTTASTTASNVSATTGSSTTAAATSNAASGATTSKAVASATTASATTASTGPQILAKGQFGRIDAIHYASGTATIGKTADGKQVLRFENFSTNQGPDLKVYLGLRADGKQLKEGGLNLGALPATDGSYNIAIPDNVDLSKYKSVVIWCEAFSVTFSVASLS